MSSPTDWSHFYHQNLSNQEQESFDEQGYDATVVTTVTATSSGGHLSPEGRVGKPARKRSRASRRTPTTLLNTDPTNFRAMVQQFTGGPSAVRFASDSVHLGGPDFGFGIRQPNAINPEGGSSQVPPFRTGSSNENTSNTSFMCGGASDGSVRQYGQCLVSGRGGSGLVARLGAEWETRSVAAAESEAKWD
ncbi:hypothetical protein GOBAR_AA04022 [Gossypium barbadense]|uniref:VQ domain-containing protein n=1 Tax=Gossypium barbadense TaxID=3634 RepID=A0A2P5YLW9_GOSBA|nr:hypothetical protein GOBAR_AA04022 [Gossypium barbadense]